LRLRWQKSPVETRGFFVGKIAGMLKQLWKFIRALFIVAVGLAATILIVPRVITTVYGWSRTYTVSSAPVDKVAIVFGAGLTRGGWPTPILRERVETAAQLYAAGKVRVLLMSGSGAGAYSEPQAMLDYAVSLGVPADAILLDHGGLRTYDTCLRARDIFGLESALLVTQGWHLPRALFLCNALGVRAAGVQAANRRYWPVMLLIWNVREQVATVGAMVDIYLSRPSPLSGLPHPMLSVKS
jgi:SanA protein